MAAKLGIQELPDEILVHVTEERNLWRVLLIAGVGSTAAFFMIRVTGSRLIKLCFGSLIGYSMLRSLIGSLRGTDVCLRVNNLDLTSSGHCPEDFSPASIARADISYMGYREATGGGGESAELPEGLYVDFEGILWTGSKCLLPHINEEQTEQVLNAIYRRFPDTGTLSPVRPAKPYLTSLNLSGR